MLKDIRNIIIQGANFESMTKLPLFNEGDDSVKATILYGRNGSGKSTIARAFRTVKGIPTENIITASVSDDKGAPITLTEAEKAHVYIFDEDFVTENVRVQEDGLGSIVMLGEQAGLTELIDAATEEIEAAERILGEKKALLGEYNDDANQKSPKYYINRMRTALQKDDGWAGRKRQIDGGRRNASVSDNTYKNFLSHSPAKTRDELVIDFNNAWKRLETAKSGVAKINVSIPDIPTDYSSFSADLGNQLLSQVIEYPELSEREQYLLSMVHSGHGDELRNTAQEFGSPDIRICPKCHQPLTEQYKAELVRSIQKVLSEEVENHQNRLQALLLPELTLELEQFQVLSSYQACIDQIAAINQRVRNNNELLQSKIADPYTPIDNIFVDIEQAIFDFEESLKRLEKEKVDHNSSVADTRPIKEELTRINNEIAYWDIIELSKQYDVKHVEKENAENDFIEAQKAFAGKQNRLNNLNAQRDSIDIAIDVINESLKYIFFSDNRLQIRVEDNTYKLICNGHPVKPKDVSAGERNVIGLCYFFANILEGKSRDAAYAEEYLLIIDDPVSSYDVENRIGILSYLKYELSKYLLGNKDSKALIMTHDLFTATDTEKILKELKVDCNKKYNGQSSFIYSQKELHNHLLVPFNNKRNEYTTLMNLVYEYANGNATEQELFIGNIIRQVLEAFSTFEYKKSINEVSTDDSVLALIVCEELRVHFKNLMYRLVLNEGSHRYDQTKNMQMDYFAFISEPDKRRTAKEILCFMELLNAPHVKAHLGEDCARIIDEWCDEILSTKS